MPKDELVKGVSFPRPAKNAVFNFEKVSKRPHLDIASVNSAMQIQIEQGVIQQVHLSAGGVAPIPLYLSRTVKYLKGKTLKIETIRQAGESLLPNHKFHLSMMCAAVPIISGCYCVNLFMHISYQ